MNDTFKKLIAASSLLVALSPLRAPAAANVYADDGVSNVAVAMPESGTASSALATNANRAKETSVENPSVRIDKTGVHIGGANPVDINVPDLKRVHREKAIDWEAIISQAVCVFGMPVAIVTIALYFKYRRNKMAHETLRMMIEKGASITPELVASLKGKGIGEGDVRPRGRPLFPGLVLLGVGTALVLSGSRGDSKAGWIVLFIGLAFLVVWLVERKNLNDQQPPR